MSDLDLYKQLLEEKKKKVEINSGTINQVLNTNNPRGTVLSGLEQELMGFSDEELKVFPINTLKALQKGFRNLIDKIKDDPKLKGMLRTIINRIFDSTVKEEAEKNIKKESIEGKDVVITEEEILDNFKDFLTLLSEAKAYRFNYKMIKDIEDGKINAPMFVQLLNTFDLFENTTRPQKQGILLFLKKLSELAESNVQIAQALNRIVRLENQKDQLPPEPEF